MLRSRTTSLGWWRSAGLTRCSCACTPSSSPRLFSTTNSRSTSSESSTPSRRPSTPPSRPVYGHLPNKPGSAFLSDIDDCFFDSMRVWKDAEGNVLEAIPTFRLMDAEGRPVDEEAQRLIEGELTKERALRMYRSMSLLPQLDQVLYSAQRQGRVSFWMTSYGEEAAVIGAAEALAADDEVFSQYREIGLLLHRGLGLDLVMAQVMGTREDQGKGRQMPNHIGSRRHHFHTVSSPLGTQLPQAAGAAYALSRTPSRAGKNVVACWFGEGAASEGDFHAGLNFASTLNCPVLWLARNNGFAISTAATEQYRGDGLACRGPGYGTLTIRVDGNDALAVLLAVTHAKRHSLSSSRPVLLELMTYRVGHHSTSDDSGSYRPRSSVDEWTTRDNPLHRMRKYLTRRGWWSDEEEEACVRGHRKEILASLGRAEKQKGPPLRALFEDTWKEPPRVLEEQRRELRRLLVKYAGDWEPWRVALEKVEGGVEGIGGEKGLGTMGEEGKGK